MAKTIDCTPTWVGIVRVYITALKHGNAEGQKAAEQELIRMAGIADKYNELVKEYGLRRAKHATETVTVINLRVYRLWLFENNLSDDSDSITIDGLTDYIETKIKAKDYDRLKSQVIKGGSFL